MSRDAAAFVLSMVFVCGASWILPGAGVARQVGDPVVGSPALEACEVAGTPVRVCLQERAASLEAELQDLLRRLRTLAPLASEEAAETAESRFREFLDRQCADAGPEMEALCRVEHLLARRNVLAVRVARMEPVVGEPAPREDVIVVPVETADAPARERERDVEPAPPPVEEPEPSPPPPRIDSPVRAMSAETPSEEREPARVEMASPMVLEVEVPVLDSLRRGYGWPTTETARFVVAGVSIPRLTVEKRERRRGVEVVVQALLYSERYLHQARVDLELLAPDDEVVGAATTDWISVGRGVPSQRGVGIEKELVVELSEEAYRQLVGGGGPPRVRLTVEGE